MKQNFGSIAGRSLLTTNLLMLAAALAGGTQKAAAAAAFPTTCEAIGCFGGATWCATYGWNCTCQDPSCCEGTVDCYQE